MSLRTRLLLGMLAVALVLVAAATVITRVTEANLVDQVDAQLAAARVPVGDLPERLGEGSPLSSVYLSAVTTDGTVRTIVGPTLRTDDAPQPLLDAERLLSGHGGGAPFTVGSEGSDRRYRSMVVTSRRLAGSTTTDGAVLTGAFVVSMPLDDVDATIDRLVAVQVAATLSVLAVLAVVTYWVLRLGVRPIKSMTTTATAIAAGELSSRVPAGDAGTEAGDLGRALNSMLETIQGSLDRRARTESQLRQFVADASHELRTPVTTIRGYAELYRTGALDEPGELREAMRRTEQEAVRMGSLVEDLLALARLDEGRPSLREPVALEAVVGDAARDARAVDPARRVRTAIDGPVQVHGDEARLRQVVANLVGNALAHTPSGSALELRLAQRDGMAVLEVSDEGPGMAPDQVDHAFERFYRADPSRSRHRGGSGLGLAIVQAAVEAHGGHVWMRSSPAAGTTVRVELPVGAPGSPEAQAGTASAGRGPAGIEPDTFA